MDQCKPVCKVFRHSMGIADGILCAERLAQDWLWGKYE